MATVGHTHTVRCPSSFLATHNVCFCCFQVRTVCLCSTFHFETQQRQSQSVRSIKIIDEVELEHQQPFAQRVVFMLLWTALLSQGTRFAPYVATIRQLCRIYP